MTVRALLFTVYLVSVSATAFAQLEQPAPAPQAPRSPAPATVPTPAPGAQPATPPAAPITTIEAPRRWGQPLNVRVDVTITDQRGGTQSFKKTVSVVTADGLTGFIRSTANYRNIGSVPLNVDTEPQLLLDGKIRLRVNLQYDLPATAADQAEQAARPEERRAGELTVTRIHENLALVLESGKPIVAAQSADPVGDRQVTIEVKATILR